MVVTMAWVHSWVAISISLVVLFILIMFLLCCLCCEPTQSIKEQKYVINEEDGIKKLNAEYGKGDETNNNQGFFKRFTGGNGGFLKNGFSLFSNSSILVGKSDIERYKNINRLERELLDSRNFDTEFNNCVLRIEKDRQRGSQESLNSFYSVFPTRKNSLASNMYSAHSDED